MNFSDSFDSGRRFIPGITTSSRLELDFFNLYAWLLHYVENKLVLDIACGSGLGSFLLAQRASRVHGIDVSEESIAFAQAQYQRNNLLFERSDAFDAKLTDAGYDVIVCSMTIEQLDPARHGEFLEKLHTALKPGGQMILVTPNKRITSPKSKTGAHHWNQREYTSKGLTLLLCNAGFIPQQWFGRRRIFVLYTYWPIRKLIGLLKRLGCDFGFFGRRESAEVRPVTLFWQAKDFVVLSRKA